MEFIKDVGKFKQAPLLFPEKFPEAAWEGRVDSGATDRFGEADSVNLSYKNRKFMADGKEVSAKVFLEILGKGAAIVYRQRPELKRIFEDALIKEQGN